MLSQEGPKIAVTTLEPVTAENRQEVLSLELDESQQGFVPDVASSLSGLEKYPDAREGINAQYGCPRVSVSSCFD